jgi:hypothetical protein
MGNVLELSVRWYTVVYILGIYRVLTPRELKNQVVNLHCICNRMLRTWLDERKIYATCPIYSPIIELTDESMDRTINWQWSLLKL